MENETAAERSKFITELLGEIDRVDETVFPPHKAADQEPTLGTVPVWLRKVFALMRYYDRECKMLMVEREYSKPEHCAADCKLCEMKYKGQLLNAILWAGLRADLTLWSEANLGIRDGWIVVRCRPEMEDGLKSFLDRLLR